MIFSGVFERYPRLTLAIVEFELSWAPHLLGTMDYLSRAPRGGDLPVQGRHAAVRLLPAQRRAQLPGGRHRIRLRDAIGVTT